jgi:hypothetical protein
MNYYLQNNLHKKNLSKIQCYSNKQSYKKHSRINKYNHQKQQD